MSEPTITPIDGYLEDEYLEDEYLGGAFLYGYGMQVNMVVKDQAAIGQQVDMVINDQDPIGMQTDMVIEDSEVIGMQVEANTDIEVFYGMQVNQEVLDALSAIGMEVKADTLRHALHDAYLVEPYLEDSYLASRMCAFMGMQVNLQVADNTDPFGMQAEMVIEDDKTLGMQIEMEIDAEDPIGMQVTRVIAVRFGMQATMVVYNITELRLMWEFPSRGTPAQEGNNWTATNTASGDFAASNLNTDIEEQVYRSTSTSIELVCDTGLAQGVPIDTIAIRNHNLTRGAQVQVQGSNNNFATINVNFNMFVEDLNMYYIAENFPTLLETNRYWKFVITDVNNPDGYVQIGCILFGASQIFSATASFLNPLIQGWRHFKDVLPTEGFTNVMNDRSLKKFIRLNFQDIDYNSGNFRIVEDMITEARTSNKILVIPTPEFPSRFAVFAKMPSLPEISHINHGRQGVGGAIVEYNSFSIEWDESL